MESHDEFLELCALSTSGELSELEQVKLQTHLAGCGECRQALREFEAAVDVGVPFLASKLSAEYAELSFSSRGTPKTPNQRGSSGVIAPLGEGEAEKSVAPDVAATGLAFAKSRRDAHAQLNWNRVWISFAACVLLGIALGINAYRIGKSRGVDVTQTVSQATNAQMEALEQQISDVGHEREGLRSQLAERDRVISDLKREIQQHSASLNKMRDAQADFEASLRNDQTEKQNMIQQRSDLAQRLETAQASLQKTQSELGLMAQQRSEDVARAAVLESRVHDLGGQLRDREQTIGKQEELLSHDRDVRELMGARDLYIAEIYDVARDGVTQKPYGRVFYTKGKSLIFYAYDLDQQAGVKNARTFQAWGQRGPDRRQALNLGIFYEDNAAKKRWVLKFDDSKTLAQIDAVFVTVEPSGGSQEPSGNPLLFAYLKIESNHP